MLTRCNEELLHRTVKRNYHTTVNSNSLHCHTFVYSSDSCHLRLWRCWSMHLFRHIDYCKLLFYAYPMDWWPGCTLSQMLLHVSCPTLDGMTTSCQYYTNCTGFRFRSGSTSTWPLWSTICCLAWLLLTWPLTVSWHLKKVIVSCTLPTRGLVSSGGPTATLGTDVSRLPAQNCGRALQLVLGKQMLAMNSLSSYLFGRLHHGTLWLFG